MDVDIAAHASECLERATPHLVHADIESLAALVPTADVILFTPLVRRANARAIARLGAGIIILEDRPRSEPDPRQEGVMYVHAGELNRRLAEAVYRAAAMRARALLRRELDRQQAVAPEAIDLLNLACERNLPPPFVKDAAEFLELRRTHAVRSWRTRAARQWPLTHFATSCPRLVDAFDWILLWRTVIEKRPGCDWIEACEAVGLTPRRFRSLVLRLTAGTPEELLDFDDWRARSPYRSIRTFGTATPRWIE